MRLVLGTYRDDENRKEVALLLARTLLGGGIIVFSVYMTETVYMDWVEVHDPGEDYRPGLLEKMKNNVWRFS